VSVHVLAALALGPDASERPLDVLWIRHAVVNIELVVVAICRPRVEHDEEGGERRGVSDRKVALLVEAHVVVPEEPFE